MGSTTVCLGVRAHEATQGKVPGTLSDMEAASTLQAQDFKNQCHVFTCTVFHS